MTIETSNHTANETESMTTVQPTSIYGRLAEKYGTDVKKAKKHH